MMEGKLRQLRKTWAIDHRWTVWPSARRSQLNRKQERGFLWGMGDRAHNSTQSGMHWRIHSGSHLGNGGEELERGSILGSALSTTGSAADIPLTQFGGQRKTWGGNGSAKSFASHSHSGFSRWQSRSRSL